MGWERGVYERGNGTGRVVSYRLAPAATPRALALIVHGAGNDALFAMAGLVKDLLVAGVEVFSFDVDGHGRGSTTVLDADTIASAVPQALEQSGAADRGLSVHGIGISLGGSLLLRALPDGGFSSATLLSAPLHIDFSTRALLNEIGRPLLGAIWRGRRHYGIGGLIPSFGPFGRAMHPLRLAGPAPPGAFGYVARLNAVLEGLRLEEAASAVRVPMALVYGEKDMLVSPEQGQRIAALIPGSMMTVLPGETHLTAPIASDALALAVTAATA
jgi:alpha-beta hydrolase superfamily lysophospholipase